eukprot:396910-Pleurochrysis_carterae.AAC.2
MAYLSPTSYNRTRCRQHICRDDKRPARKKLCSAILWIEGQISDKTKPGVMQQSYGMHIISSVNLLKKLLAEARSAAGDPVCCWAAHPSEQLAREHARMAQRSSAAQRRSALYVL